MEKLNAFLKSLSPKEERYFYSTIPKEKVLLDLISQRVFENPPESKITGQLTEHPEWPPLILLKNISKKENIKTHRKHFEEAICQIELNNNQRVLYEYSALLIRVLPPLQQKLTENLLEHVVLNIEQPSFILVKNILDLISEQIKLLKPELLKHIYSYLLQFNSDYRELGGEFNLSYTEIRPQIDDHQYEEIVRDRLPEFIKTYPKHGIEFLIQQFSELLHHDDIEQNCPIDSSFIWRPDLLKEDVGYDPQKMLYDALVKESVKAVESSLIDPNELIELLLKHQSQWSALIRLSVHLYDQHYEKLGNQYIKIFDLKRLINEINLWHEVSVFLNNHFSKFDRDDRSQILDLIINQEIPDGKLKEFKVLQQLQVIENYLEGNVKDHFNDLVSRHGKIKDPYFHFRSGTTWVGPTSPKNIDDLNQMSPEQLLEYLKTWSPEGNWDSPTPEGLSRYLKDYFKESFRKYISLGDSLRELDITYIRSFIEGMRDATINQEDDWSEILGLCQWVVNQGNKQIDRDWHIERGFDADPDMSWIRKVIADLLDEKISNNEIPIEYFDIVWSIIKLLCKDPQPTPVEVESQNSNSLKSFDLSINTVRGKAIHAMFQFYLWGIRKDKINSIKDYDELFEACTHLLDDPSLAIRSVYGYFFPSLLRADEEVALSWLDKIFPGKESQLDFYLSAIKGFDYCMPWNVLLEKCPQIYGTLFNHYQNGLINSRQLIALDNVSIAHIWYYIITGQMKVHENTIVMTILISDDNDYTRAFIGKFKSIYTVSYTDDHDAMMESLFYIWGQLLNNAKKFENSDSQKIHDYNAISYFGNWLLMPIFQEKEYLGRALDLIIEGLEKLPFLTPLTKIMDYLESLSSEKEHGQQILKIVFRLIDDKIYFGFIQGSDNLKSILKNLSKHNELKSDIRNVVNKLIGQGFYDYKSFS